MSKVKELEERIQDVQDYTDELYVKKADIGLSADVRQLHAVNYSAALKTLDNLREELRREKLKEVPTVSDPERALQGVLKYLVELRQAKANAEREREWEVSKGRVMSSFAWQDKVDIYTHQVAELEKALGL